MINNGLIMENEWKIWLKEKIKIISLANIKRINSEYNPSNQFSVPCTLFFLLDSFLLPTFRQGVLVCCVLLAMYTHTHTQIIIKC